MSIEAGIKAVLFDHDDTLVETFKPKSRQHIHVAREFYGIDLSEEEIREHWGKPLSELFKILYRTEDIETAEKHAKAVLDDFPKLKIDGAVETLESLRQMGFYTGVVTATAAFSFKNDVKRLGLEGNFDYMQTQEDTLHHKPDARVFKPALAWLGQRGVKASQILYIGDGKHDLEAATGAGLNFIGVETGLSTEDDFRKWGSLSIKSVAELLK